MTLQIIDIGLGVLEVTPKRFGDARGFFAETWQRDQFAAAGIDVSWVQDNQSRSTERGVLRGLHLQIAPAAQQKLIRVLKGAIFDVAVDVRPGSPSFGAWVTRELSAKAFNQLLIPAGFAHGFLTLTPEVEVFYKVDAPYMPTAERSIRWNDPALAIPWPLPAGEVPLLSSKDAAAPTLAHVAAELTF